MKVLGYNWAVIIITLDGETVWWYKTRKEAEKRFEIISSSARKPILEVQLLHCKRRHFMTEKGKRTCTG